MWEHRRRLSRQSITFQTSHLIRLSQVVPPEHRSLLYNIIDSYKQMLVCQPFIHSAEKGLTIGSFSDAVRQINKLTQSKGVKGLYHDVDILKGFKAELQSHNFDVKFSCA